MFEGPDDTWCTLASVSGSQGKLDGLALPSLSRESPDNGKKLIVDPSSEGTCRMPVSALVSLTPIFMISGVIPVKSNSAADIDLEGDCVVWRDLSVDMLCASAFAVGVGCSSFTVSRASLIAPMMKPRRVEAVSVSSFPFSSRELSKWTFKNGFLS